MNVEMDSVTGVPALSNYFNSLPLNPTFIVIIIIVILAYVLLFSSLGSAGSDTSWKAWRVYGERRWISLDTR